MKIDTDDIDVFKVTVPHSEAAEWLMDEGAELIDVNSAIDAATSFAADFGRAIILIEIVKS